MLFSIQNLALLDDCIYIIRSSLKPYLHILDSTRGPRLVNRTHLDLATQSLQLFLSSEQLRIKANMMFSSCSQMWYLLCFFLETMYLEAAFL